MGRPLRGDMVVVPFPFSDLLESKRRPALVVATEGDDLMLAQVTSRVRPGGRAVALGPEDFHRGGLRVPSHVRPAHLFTADAGLVLYVAGRVTEAKRREVVSHIEELLDA